MHSKKFDELISSLAAAPSRRNTLKGLVGSLATLGAIGAAAALCRREALDEACTARALGLERAAAMAAEWGAIFELAPDRAAALVGTVASRVALLAALVHGTVETTVWPETIGQWLAVIALGVGPVGAAFFAWDVGMKRGDIRVLGAASYATPLLSTTFLILAGYAAPSATIAIAAVLIAGGGLIAAKDMVWRQP